FIWHRRWTWSDRHDTVGTGARLVRFHLTNGVVSLAGNLMVMALLVNLGRMHYLAANGIAVLICSVANFVLSDRLVFVTVASVGLLLSAGSTDAKAADLNPAASQ